MSYHSHSRQGGGEGGSVVRLVVLSDTHNRHRALTSLLPPPPSSSHDNDKNHVPTILLHCGDFCDRGRPSHLKSFRDWLSADDDKTGLPGHYDEVVVIDGNHDHTRPPLPPLDLESEFAECNRVFWKKGMRRQVYFLQDDSVSIHGVRIHGVSWKSVKFDNYEGDYSAVVVASDEDEGSVPDVILSHLIPHLDQSAQAVAQSHGGPIDFRAWRGSARLYAVARRHRIPLVLSGHVHWGRGAVFVPHDDGNTQDGDDNDAPSTGTWFVNAASTKPHVNSKRTQQQACQDAAEASQGEEEDVSPPVVIYYDTQHRRVLDISCPGHTYS